MKKRKITTRTSRMPKAHEIELSLDETPARESKASDMRVEIATGEKADLIPSGGEPAFEIDEKTREEDEAYTGDVTQPYNPRLDLEHYKFPTLDLLNTYNDNERPSTWRNRMPTRTASSRCSAVRHSRSVRSRPVWSDHYAL